jgi:hypothetical protein
MIPTNPKSQPSPAKEWLIARKSWEHEDNRRGIMPWFTAKAANSRAHLLRLLEYPMASEQTSHIQVYHESQSHGSIKIWKSTETILVRKSFTPKFLRMILRTSRFLGEVFSYFLWFHGHGESMQKTTWKFMCPVNGTWSTFMENLPYHENVFMVSYSPPSETSIPGDMVCP